MDTTSTSDTPATEDPRFVAGGLFLDKLAAADFGGLARALEPDVEMRALLPSGYRELEGRDAVRSAFSTWFGDLDEFEVLDASVGMVGPRLQMRWRIHARGERFGDEDMVAEQHVYADAGPNGRLRSLSLVCSGFCQEHPDV